MRYIIPRKHISIVSLLKLTLSFAITVALTFCVLKYYGSAIVSSATRFVFPDTQASKPVPVTAPINFENDFLTFLDYSETETDETPTPTVQPSNLSAITVNLSAVSGKYKNYNGTAVINNTDYSVTELLNSSYKKPSLNTSEPYILIYHTHTSEQYHGGGSVVDVGKTMKAEFERLGYKTIHVTDVYDKEQFSGAYSRSVKGAKAMLEKYPTIKLVFDVHRDSITSQNGTVYQPLTTVNGENCAQVMLVCGTDEKGLSHPDWRENFKFALDVSRTMGEKFGDLSRPVNLRGDRFNTHLTNHSFLIEMGSNANTLDEAKRAAVYTAQSIIETIEK